MSIRFVRQHFLRGGRGGGLQQGHVRNKIKEDVAFEYILKGVAPGECMQRRVAYEVVFVCDDCVRGGNWLRQHSCYTTGIILFQRDLADTKNLE